MALPGTAPRCGQPAGGGRETGNGGWKVPQLQVGAIASQLSVELFKRPVPSYREVN